MNDFYIGLITTAGTIALIEILRNFDRRLIGALTLTGIAFIYIGFTVGRIPSLIYAMIAVGFFAALSYFGYKKNFLFIIIGLVLHGVWDMLFPLFSSLAPNGYDVFCITVDVLLAIYFYLRIKPLRSPG